eukprot:UN12856
MLISNLLLSCTRTIFLGSMILAFEFLAFGLRKQTCASTLGNTSKSPYTTSQLMLIIII